MVASRRSCIRVRKLTIKSFGTAKVFDFGRHGLLIDDRKPAYRRRLSEPPRSKNRRGARRGQLGETKTSKKKRTLDRPAAEDHQPRKKPKVQPKKVLPVIAKDPSLKIVDEPRKPCSSAACGNPNAKRQKRPGQMMKRLMTDKSIREKQREDFRAALKKMEENVVEQNDHKYMRELQKLCGWRSPEFQNPHILESFGLFLKRDDERLDEEGERVLEHGKLHHKPTPHVPKNSNVSDSRIRGRVGTEKLSTKADRITKISGRNANVRISKAQSQKTKTHQCIKRLRREKEREDFRMKLEKMEEEVVVENDHKYMQELQKLCGWRSPEFQNPHILESFGLLLKKDDERLEEDEPVMEHGKLHQEPTPHVPKDSNVSDSRIRHVGAEKLSTKADRNTKIGSRNADVITKAQTSQKTRKHQYTSRQRLEKDRENFRMKLKKMEEQVVEENDHKYMWELQKLCRWCSSQFQNPHVVERFGLFLKKDEEDVEDQAEEQSLLRKLSPLPQPKAMNKNEIALDLTYEADSLSKKGSVVQHSDTKTPPNEADNRIAMIKNRYADIISKSQKYKHENPAKHTGTLKKQNWRIENEANAISIIA